MHIKYTQLRNYTSDQNVQLIKCTLHTQSKCIMCNRNTCAIVMRVCDRNAEMHLTTNAQNAHKCVITQLIKCTNT